MFAKVLVAYDGSVQSKKAFETALEIATRFAATLEVLAVIRLPEPAVRVELDAVLEEARKHYDEEFQQLDARAAARGLQISTITEVGHPAEQIVHVAERDGIELILMGRRGRTGLQRWVLGSVSERVLRYAHCGVLVVH